MTLVVAAAMLAVLSAAGVAWAAVIDGGPTANTINGTASGDTIKSYDGNDTVYGLEGNDNINGGNGADTLYGAEESQYYPGADYVVGAAGNDRIFGAAESDQLHGGYGIDSIWEGPPDDEAPDTITGGPDDDRIYAASGAEEVTDTIRCDAGRDEVWVDGADSVAADCEVVNRQPTVASVAFTRPVQVETVTQLASTYDSQIGQIESDFSIAGELNNQGVVNPTQGDPVRLKQELEESRLGYFEDSVGDIEQLPAEWRADLQPQYDAMKAAIAANDAGTPTVTDIMVTGELPDLQALSSESSSVTEDGQAVIESVQVADPEEVAEASTETEPLNTDDSDPSLGVSDGPDADPLQPPTNLDGTPSLEARTSWWPNQGRSFVKDSPNFAGKRYSGQWFSWDNNTLGNDDGYEHTMDIQFGDRKSYLSGTVKRDGSCFPANATWFDNYGSARSYLDTNLAPIPPVRWYRCSSKIRTFSVGVIRAGFIRDGKPYHTYVRVPKGRVNSDAAALVADRTHYKNALGTCTPRHPEVPAFCWFQDSARILIDPQGADSPVTLFKVPVNNKHWTEWKRPGDAG